MNEEQLDKIGRLVDRCENYIAGTVLPLPPQMHVDGMKSGFESMRDELKELFFAGGGDKDTWL